MPYIVPKWLTFHEEGLIETKEDTEMIDGFLAIIEDKEIAMEFARDHGIDHVIPVIVNIDRRPDLRLIKK